MRLELHLADERSAVDVEHLVNLRTLRLWPGGLGKLRLQSDYGYRRRTPRWAHLAFVWDRTNYQTPASERFLTGLAATEPERAHSQALSQELDQVSVRDVTSYLAQAATPAQEFLAASSLVLSRKTTVAQLAGIMRKGLLPGLFDRYPDARLCYLEISTEASHGSDPYNLSLENPSLLETLGYGLGHIHGWANGWLTDLTRFFPEAPRPSEVESLVLAVAERMNDLLVALYDIEGFDSLDEQLSACFTTARLYEEVATGFLTTNAYLRKIAFFNVWDKVTGIQKEARKDLPEGEVKRRLVQPETFRTRVLASLPHTLPSCT